MPRLSANPLPPLDLGPESIGQRLTRFRGRLGITQVQLAERMGISRHSVADYEKDRTRLYSEMLARFSIALGVSADEILGTVHQASAGEPGSSRRLMKRISEIDQLPEAKKKAILKTLDDLIRANT